MFYAPGHHDELAGLERNCAISELDAELSFYHHEQFIFVLVVVLDEFALHLVKFHLLSVQFAHDIGLPQFRNLIELFRNIDFVHRTPQRLDGAKDSGIEEGGAKKKRSGFPLPNFHGTDRGNSTSNEPHCQWKSAPDVPFMAMA